MASLTPTQAAATAYIHKSLADHGSGELSEVQLIRSKILGVQIRLSRQETGRTLEDCASKLQVSEEQFSAWEYGNEVPSVPKLELLARYLDVPVSQFWQENASDSTLKPGTEHDEFVALRQRLVGGLLRAARQAKQLTVEQLGDLVPLDVALIRQYEYGERRIPVDQLSVLARVLDRDLNFFLEDDEVYVAALQAPASTQVDQDLPEVLRQYSTDDKTLGLVKLAVAFSHIRSEELDQIAHALLAISKAKAASNGA